MARLWSPVKRLAICKRCKGQCCYLPSMTVILDREEHDRKLYQYRYEKELVIGHGYVAVLRKRKDGSCVYYDREKRMCSIYRRRPHSCKSFFCGRGRKGTSWSGRSKDHVWKSLRAREQRGEEE